MNYDHKSTSIPVVVRGYNIQGLPFQILVNAKSNKEGRKFIEECILPRIDQYAMNIAMCEEGRENLVTQLLLAEIARTEQAKAINYMNFVCVSESQNNILLSGFGFGKGGVLVNGANQNSYQPLKQDKNRMQNDISARCTLFCREVERLDEIVNYAELPNALITNDLYQPTDGQANNEHTLYRKLSTDTQTIVELEGNKHNTAIAQIIIPTQEEQIKNQELIIPHIKEATEKYIVWMQKNTQGIRGIQRFSHFFHGHSGLQRAQNILNLINNNASSEEIFKATQKAFEASGSRQHSYSRYLLDTISLTKTFENNVSDSEFAQQKAQTSLFQ